MCLQTRDNVFPCGVGVCVCVPGPGVTLGVPMPSRSQMDSTGSFRFPLILPTPRRHRKTMKADMMIVIHVTPFLLSLYPIQGKVMLRISS